MMKKYLCLILLTISPALFAQSGERLAALETKIDSLLDITPGNFAVAFKDLSEENTKILINESKVFHAASTMKTPVMIELFKQEAAGKFSLQDSVKIKNEFTSIVSGDSFTLDINRDSGDSLYSRIGEQSTIEDLIIDMVINSSNLATNILIELVDAENVTQTMRNLGAEHIEVLRGVEDMEAYEAGLSNTTTALDLLVIFENLAEGNVVNKEASNSMIEILLQQSHKNIIPAFLPSEVRVANKTGSITGLHHDSGIVFLPNGKAYVLILLSDELEYPEKGITVMASVSKVIYDYMVSN